MRGVQRGARRRAVVGMSAHEAELVWHAASNLHQVRDALAGVRLDPADDLYPLTGEVSGLLPVARALVDRLAWAAGEVGTRPGLRVDDVGPPASPEQVAGAACTALGRGCVLLAQAAAEVDTAHAALGRLYVADDEGEGAVR